MTSPRPDLLRTFWRALSLLPVSVVVMACSSDGGGDWSELYHAVRISLEDTDNAVSLDQAGAIPFATLGIKINDDHEQILVLATDSHGERLWTSSAHVAITTRYGRVVQTAGLGQDLSSYYGSPGGANFLTPAAYSWTADFREMGLYAVPVACEIHPAVPDPITILGAELHTVRVDETCNSGGIGWSFTNSYWVAPDTNRVWRSIQHVHPDGMTLEIQILRPVVGEY